MRLLLAAVVCAALSGCADSTLIVRGNTGITAYVAERAMAWHEQTEACASPRAEKRVAKSQKKYQEGREVETYLYVRHECRN